MPSVDNLPENSKLLSATELVGLSSMILWWRLMADYFLKHWDLQDFLKNLGSWPQTEFIVLL